MKLQSVSLKSGLYALLLAPTFFVSCKKEQVPTNQSQGVLTEENSDASVFRTLENGLNKLVLRPGPDEGQDVYVDKLQGYPSGNLNWVPELPINQWTVGGTPLNTRSFIKFDDLSLIPANANIVSAKLLLYGMSSSLNSPQGNSTYPGSPYSGFGDNSCWVQQVVGADWDESTLTYDNQPAGTTTDEAELAASTSQWNYNTTVDVTAIVKKMVASPETNYGFGIKLKTEQLYRSIVFASSEATCRTQRPKLVVIYQ